MPHVNEWVVTGPGAAWHRFEDEDRALTRAAQLAMSYGGVGGQPGRQVEVEFPSGAVVRFAAERVR